MFEVYQVSCIFWCSDCYSRCFSVLVMGHQSLPRCMVLLVQEWRSAFPRGEDPELYIVLSHLHLAGDQVVHLDAVGHPPLLPALETPLSWDLGCYPSF